MDRSGDGGRKARTPARVVGKPRDASRRNVFTCRLCPPVTGKARPGHPGQLGSGTAAAGTGRFHQARPSLGAADTVSSPSQPIYGDTISRRPRLVKGGGRKIAPRKSQALNAHNFSLLVLSNFDKPTWPPSCPMVGSLRVFLFCSPCSAPLTSSPFDCPLCWFLPVTRSARSPAGTPGT